MRWLRRITKRLDGAGGADIGRDERLRRAAFVLLVLLNVLVASVAIFAVFAYAFAALRRERANAERLLLNILPAPIAGRTRAGDTLNVASRLEAMAPPGGIRVGELTARALAPDHVLLDRETVAVRGRGEMSTYLLHGRRA
jgi:hypothetical protein